MGGLQTDVDFNVMDTEDEVIEGLYAVGNAQGGRFLVDYPLPAPGISHGMALTHGMLVGRILRGCKPNNPVHTRRPPLPLGELENENRPTGSNRSGVPSSRRKRERGRGNGADSPLR